MSGISAIFDLNGIDIHNLYDMSISMKHRGPYGCVVFLIDKFFCLSIYHVNDKTNINFLTPGHSNKFIIGAALNILHPNNIYTDSNVARFTKPHLILLDGSLSNKKELITRLTGKGYSFEKKTDEEIIYYSYREWKEQLSSHFAGSWAFIIVDIQKRQLIVSRDRLGAKPLYYFQNGRNLVLASEIKGLLKSRLVDRKLNKRAFLQFIHLGKTIDKHKTLFQEIEEFPQSSTLQFDMNNSEKKWYCYYEIDKYNNHIGNFKDYEEAKEQYSERLASAINSCIGDETKIGIGLSGGIDSSSIAILCARLNPGLDINTFTAVYSDRTIDESHFAKLVVNANSSIKGNFFAINPLTIWQEMDKFIWHQELPVNSSSVFAQWELMKQASQKNLRVILSGTGADGPLGGFSISAGMYLLLLIKKLNFSKLLSESSYLHKNRQINAFKEMARAYFNSLPYKIQKIFRSNIKALPNVLTDNVESDFLDDLQPKKSFKSFNDFAINGLKSGLAMLLRYEDRNAMAFSIEPRSPFIDHRLVEYTLSVPAEFKFKKGFSKHILRDTVKPFLPEEVVWRRDKKGFLTPQLEWKLVLKPYILEYIQNSRLPDLLDRRKILQFLQGDYDENSKLSEFWKLVTIIRWYNLFF